MRSAIFIILAGLLLCAQSPVGSFPPGTFAQRGALDASATTSYSGPGDIVSGASMFFGLRGYNAAFSGAVANICDQATGLVCADATFATSGGVGTLTLPTIGGLACNNSTNICVVNTLYDQTGNGFNVTQATNSARPTLTLSCIGALPCMTFVSASSQSLLSSATYTRASPWSGVFVGNRTASGSVVFAIGFQTGIGANRGIGWVAGADTTTIVSSTFLSTTAVDSTFHAVQGATGASGTISVDGSSATGNAGANGITAQTVKIGTNGSSTFLDGQLTEAGVWPAAFSAPNISSLNTNAHSYWGF